MYIVRLALRRPYTIAVMGLLRRALKAGLSDRIDARICLQDSLGMSDIAGKIDFVLAFALVHEVPDKELLFAEIYNTMKQTGELLIAEPKGHVSKPRKQLPLLKVRALKCYVT